MNILLTPYIIILFILLGMSLLHRKGDTLSQDISSWLSLNVLILFFGLRGAVGDDYQTYLSCYEQPTLSNAVTFGPAYSGLCWFFHNLHLPFRLLVFSLSVLTNALLFRFARRLQLNTPFVMAVFFAMSGVVNQIDFVRNVVSIMLFANSIEYLVNRKPREYFAINAVGFLFHYSAILYIPLYWFGRRSLKRETYAILLLLALALLPLHIPLLDWTAVILSKINLSYCEHLATYITTYSHIKLGFTLGTFERIVTATLVYLYYPRLSKDPHGHVATLCFLTDSLCYSLLSNYAILATRLGNLFVCGYWMLWPLFLRYQRRESLRWALGLLMVGYMVCRLANLASMSQWQYRLC